MSTLSTQATVGSHRYTCTCFIDIYGPWAWYQKLVATLMGEEHRGVQDKNCTETMRNTHAESVKIELASSYVM